MNKWKKGIFVALLCSSAMVSCQEKAKETKEDTKTEESIVVDKFADIQILQYNLDGWDALSLQQKKLIYYLSQAAISGRDIIWDQNCRYNLRVRKSLETILETYTGEKSGEEWGKFVEYSKRVFFSNGIHHHYAEKKIKPEFSKEYFDKLMKNSDTKLLPIAEGSTVDELIKTLDPVLFNPEYMAKRVNKDKGIDIIAKSATNFYEGVSAAEVDAFYQKMKKPGDKTPISVGLNSKLMKVNGKLVEKVYKVGGMYGSALEKMVFWLNKAVEVAENDQQGLALKKLVSYYQTGDLKTFDEYNIAWVNDTTSVVDVINGFIENYGDPKGYKATYESVVSYKDPAASARMKVISENAQWFEDNSTIMKEHKKKNVTGISYRVITVAQEAGDAAPSTPIGINLPNANWIRETHGSKSVSLNNIVVAYDKAAGPGSLKEFAHDQEEIDRSIKYGELAGNLHTALHEVIGHASGKMNEGIAEPHITLKNYSSTLEEARADLVALYYLLDNKLVEMGVMPNLEVGKAEYDSYIRNGLMIQLRRLDAGENLEEDHMRNRQLVAAWAFEKGKKDGVIERIEKDGKTFYDIKNYEKLRVLFGELLKEIQRIKSEGDYKSAEALVETYGVIVDQNMITQVKERYKNIDTKPYSGFVQPYLIPVMDKNGEITDVKVEYEKDFVRQMLKFGKEAAFLPSVN